MDRTTIRTNTLVSSLFVGATVVAAFWLTTVSFHYTLPVTVAAFVPLVSGILFGSERLLLLHAAVISSVTLTIWNSPLLWHVLFGVPAPGGGLLEAVYLSIVFVVLFALGILGSRLVTRWQSTDVA